MEKIQMLIDKLNKDGGGRIVGKLSDGHHSFDDLYNFRKVYNALLVKEYAKSGEVEVYKSWKHSDGEFCFGDPHKWFIVEMMLPTGQVTNHYRAADWDLFDIPEVAVPKNVYDGHSPLDTLNRMERYAKGEMTK